MIYYNKFSRVLVFDALDLFLISLFIASIVGSYAKNYFSEELAMKRLKNSIINKSTLVSEKPPILNSTKAIRKYKAAKLKKIYKFALQGRGGEIVQQDKMFKLVQEIQKIVELLAYFLKQRELKGRLKIFFRGGTLLLQLILNMCDVELTYWYFIGQGPPNIKFYVFSSVTGGAVGFITAWTKVGAILFSPPLILSLLGLKSLLQQGIHLTQHLIFKNMMDEMLDDPNIQETLQTTYIDGNDSTFSSNNLNIELTDVDLDEIPTFLKHDFNLNSRENYEKFIKNRMKEELGIIENPTKTQFKQILEKKLSKKVKGKTMYFKDFIKSNEGADLPLDSEMINTDILDAEILEEPIRIDLDNEL